MTSQEGRVAVVTGASRGIGKATALTLADAGFDLVLAARTVKSGDETSQAGMVDRPLKLARGDWGYAHGATKAALHRMAGLLHVEYGDRGICAYNLEPGLVRSESLIASLGENTELEKMGIKSAPVEVPAAVIAWLCTTEDAIAMSGQNVYAQPFCVKKELLPGWP